MNQQLYTTAEINISNSGVLLSAKDQHLFRRALEEALEEAAYAVMDKFGVVNEQIHPILIEEIEEQSDEE